MAYGFGKSTQIRSIKLYDEKVIQLTEERNERYIKYAAILSPQGWE